MKDYRLDYYKVPTAPWSSESEQVENIVISEGITSIEERAFYKCSSLATATLPKRFENQIIYVFDECDKLKAINWI